MSQHWLRLLKQALGAPVHRLTALRPYKTRLGAIVAIRGMAINPIFAAETGLSGIRPDS